MGDLLKLALVLAIAFASTFLVMQGLGLMPEEGVIRWLQDLRGRAFVEYREPPAP